MDEADCPSPGVIQPLFSKQGTRTSWQRGCKGESGTDAQFVAATGSLAVQWGMKAGRPPSEWRRVRKSVGRGNVAGSSAL